MQNETKNTTQDTSSTTITTNQIENSIRINIFTTGGHHFSAEIVTELDDIKIFEELLTGNQECIHIARMCFVKKNLTAVVLEDVQPITQQGSELLPKTIGNNGNPY